MATLASAHPIASRDTGFFLSGALAMFAVLAGGFSLHLAMGRSTFAAPLPVHVHAFIFFGWASLYVLQNALAHTGVIRLHRRLGWLALFFVPAMIVMGIYLTVGRVRAGSAPFFFEPLYFLIMNPLSVLTFAGLTSAAIMLRRRTRWHRRLMFCGMAVLTGPGFGRLLPMPLFIPWASWVLFAAIMLFPLWGMARDLKVGGKVHPAWWWGASAIIGVQLASVLIAASPAGLSIYEAVTRGSPGAAVLPLAYPAPPM